MPEMHLRQPGFAYSTCDIFTKNKKISNFQISKEYKIQNIFINTN